MNNATVSTAGQNLLSSRWNAFQLTAIPNSAWTQITVANFASALSFTINKLTTLATIGGTQPTEYRFLITGGGVVPAWLQYGTAVIIAGTVGGIDAIAGRYTVKNIATDGTSFDVMSNGLLSASQTAATITSGLCTLIPQCQKVMIRAPSTNSDSVLFAPNVDVAGNVLWSETLGAGQSYEVTAPSPNPMSHKFDLTDWWVKSNAGTQTLQFRFV